jgi:hypothetical protein
VLAGLLAIGILYGDDTDQIDPQKWQGDHAAAPMTVPAAPFHPSSAGVRARMPMRTAGYRTSMDSEAEQEPVKETRKVALVVLGGIAAVLLVFLVIVLLMGDPTDHLGERQPEPSPATTSP